MALKSLKEPAKKETVNPEHAPGTVSFLIRFLKPDPVLEAEFDTGR